MDNRRIDAGGFSFKKNERLHHQSLVDGLFRCGKSLYVFPYRVSWRMLSLKELEKNFRDRVPTGIGKLQMLVAVPKKKRRRAVDRVLLRRRIREAYRLRRHKLKDALEHYPELGTLSVAFVYVHDKNLPYAEIDGAMSTALEKLSQKVFDLSSSPGEEN